jgi:hypothetical protein
MRPQGVSASGQKKGIFGESGRRRCDGSAPGEPLARVLHEIAAQVSAGPISVMSLAEKNRLLRFPIQARHPMLLKNN